VCVVVVLLLLLVVGEKEKSFITEKEGRKAAGMCLWNFLTLSKSDVNVENSKIYSFPISALLCVFLPNLKLNFKEMSD